MTSRLGGGSPLIGGGGIRDSAPPPDEIPEEMFPSPSKTYKRNPLVIAGGLLTAGVLVGGLVAFRNGNQNISQNMMRTRVLFQGATVALMLASSGVSVNQIFGNAAAKFQQQQQNK
ncbi:HIG1 domain-containing protein [Pycnococcus provasolii]|mmetsp:Transcript_10544/g.26773  ORF Transcript_10544/g.26773 Transcript_10544/m.26773 type:complete len:116 (-) Transcript_10544:143-490(-)